MSIWTVSAEPIESRSKETDICLRACGGSVRQSCRES
jgi:hypothetical protein